MAASTLTSKGQVTIPKAIRDALGVAPGDRVVFRLNAAGEVIVEAAHVDLLSLAGSLKPRRRGVTVEEMKETIRNLLVEEGFRAP